jgi:hypothetical protein
MASQLTHLSAAVRQLAAALDPPALTELARPHPLTGRTACVLYTCGTVIDLGNSHDLPIGMWTGGWDLISIYKCVEHGILKGQTFYGELNTDG